MYPVHVCTIHRLGITIAIPWEDGCDALNIVLKWTTLTAEKLHGFLVLYVSNVDYVDYEKHITEVRITSVMCCQLERDSASF
jgi:hypothetical protein